MQHTQTTPTGHMLTAVTRSRRFARGAAALLVALLTLTIGVASAGTATAAAADEPATIRVNAGGPEVPSIDDGPAWAADSEESPSDLSNWQASHSYVMSTDADITVPEDWTAPPEILTSARADSAKGQPMTWALPAPVGMYDLHLYFAEIDADASALSRVFSVVVEGETAVENLDIVGAVGAFAAHVETVRVTSDGVIDIAFEPLVNAPLISAIELVPYDPAVVSASPAALDFGHVLLGESSTLPLTLVNSGGADAIITAAVPDGFTTSIVDEVVVPAHGETEVTVTFAPAVAGTYDVAMELAYDGADEPVIVALAGVADDPTAEPTASPSPEPTASPSPEPTTDEDSDGGTTPMSTSVLEPQLEATAYSLMQSSFPDRSAPSALADATVAGDAYVFTTPDTDVSRVRFWLDDDTMSGTPDKVENREPYDFAGTAPDDTAYAWDTTTVTDGTHSITAELSLADGSVVILTSSFTVGNTAPSLTANPSSVTVVAVEGDGPTTTTVDVTADDGGTPTVTATPSTAWIAVTPESASAPASFSVETDPTGLTSGTHTGSVVFAASGYANLTVSVTLTISDAAADYSLVYSTSADRTAPVALDDAAVSGDIYAFTTPTTDVKRVRFYVDDPLMSGSPVQTENSAPYDLAGGSASKANPFDTTTLPDGEHSVTARIETTNDSVVVVTAPFTVANSSPSLQVSDGSIALTLQADSPPATESISVFSSDDSTGTYTTTVSSGATWLTVDPATGPFPDVADIIADPAGLAVGEYTGTVTFAAAGYVSAMTTVTIEVVDLSTAYAIDFSLSPDRTAPQPLDGAAVADSIYAFATPTTGVKRVEFFIDDPLMTSAPFQTENSAPYDLAGGSADAANPFDTNALVDGEHTVTARVSLTDGTTEVAQATFSVSNGAVLVSTPGSLDLAATIDGSPVDATIDVSTLDGASAEVTATDNADWLAVSPSGGTTPVSLTVTADPAGLDAGSYVAAITLSAAGYPDALVDVTLTVGSEDDICYPLACEELLVSVPYLLEFNEDRLGILDANGVGTGFTYVQPTTNGLRYIPENIALDLFAGNVTVTTTAGIQSGSANSMDNALGVGIDAPSQISVLQVTVENVPEGTGNYEQAGLWFGLDEDNYVKLTVQSSPSGPRIEFLEEVAGSTVAKQQNFSPTLVGADVKLRLTIDPYERTISAAYTTGSSFFTTATFDAPSEFFSFDAAGIDPTIGTRSFGGIFATHRNATAPMDYTFREFSLTAAESDAVTSSLSFTRLSAPVSMPTAMVWGPDDRLYVSELLGTIHALTYDADWNVIADQEITTLGSRLTLGLTVDPASTASDVRLVVAHSSPSLNAGEVNSSTVTYLSGSDFTTRSDIITGLPRALANHAINHVHFGSDGQLYIAMGGNTGAGAPNDGDSEFGDRPEQPLSAALLVADVNAAGFEGDCATPLYEFGVPETCDVTVYSSGLRNMYDFVEHSNGNLYGPDNGLGVLGTYPPSPTPDCTGLSPLENDPGSQTDELNLLEPGLYYGHPNPYRDECVFKDGSWQGVAAPANYTEPILDLGANRSANGIIEYTGDAFCGALSGNLLITNYSVGDNITFARLADDGRSVTSSGTVIDGLDDPLPIVAGPGGVIFVGEFGSSSVTTLVPNNGGCWSSSTPVPAKLLDSSGASVGDVAYVIAGKTSAGHVSTVYAYDTIADQWTSKAPLPGPGVENPAVAASNGLIYAFGGSTEPFAGAVSNAAVYDPLTDTWTSLAPMPTARGGATASAVGGSIYVVGGMNADGASVTTVEIYDIASNTWSTGPSLATARDNPGSAAIDGHLYVVGGRTRLADGTVVNGTLASMEVLDLTAGTWSAGPDMPTGRRTFAVGTLGGRFQVVGGEATVDGAAFTENEEFDPTTGTWRILPPIPTARHGAAAATIGDTLHLFGGGIVAGSSFTDLHDVFTYGES